MTTKTKGQPTGEFMVSEANGTRARESVTVTVPAATTLPAGTVLGQLSATGVFVSYDNAETDGREEAAGVLYTELVNEDASDPADLAATIIARDAEVRDVDLVFATGTSNNDKAAAKTDLAALGVIAR